MQEWYKGHQKLTGAETSKGCKGSKKVFCNWDISKRKMKENVDLLLNGVGDQVMNVKKTDLYCSFFISVFTGSVCSQASLKGHGDQGTFLMT